MTRFLVKNGALIDSLPPSGRRSGVSRNTCCIGAKNDGRRRMVAEAVILESHDLERWGTSMSRRPFRRKTTCPFAAVSLHKENDQLQSQDFASGETDTQEDDIRSERLSGPSSEQNASGDGIPSELPLPKRAPSESFPFL